MTLWTQLVALNTVGGKSLSDWLINLSIPGMHFTRTQFLLMELVFLVIRMDHATYSFWNVYILFSVMATKAKIETKNIDLLCVNGLQTKLSDSIITFELRTIETLFFFVFVFSSGHSGLWIV